MNALGDFVGNLIFAVFLLVIFRLMRPAIKGLLVDLFSPVVTEGILKAMEQYNREKENDNGSHE